MRRVQITIASLMRLTVITSLVIARSLNPSALLALVFHTFLIVLLFVAIIGGLMLCDGNFALHGLLVGDVAMIGLGVLPILHAVVGDPFGIAGPSGDVIPISVPFLAAPWIGGGIGLLIPRTTGESVNLEDRSS
jgi:hypothetical protein